jgi:hypothetical protein
MINNQHAGSSASQYRTETGRPMRDLLNQLRQVQPEVTITGVTDIPHRLSAPMAAAAETVMAMCQNGMAAVGQLMAHSSPVIEDGTVGADSVESLGWLISESGDLSGYCLVLASECRRTQNINSSACNLVSTISNEPDQVAQ